MATVDQTKAVENLQRLHTENKFANSIREADKLINDHKTDDSILKEIFYLRFLSKTALSMIKSAESDRSIYLNLVGTDVDNVKSKCKTLNRSLAKQLLTDYLKSDSIKNDENLSKMIRNEIQKLEENDRTVVLPRKESKTVKESLVKHFIEENRNSTDLYKRLLAAKIAFNTKYGAVDLPISILKSILDSFDGKPPIPGKNLRQIENQIIDDRKVYIETLYALGNMQGSNLQIEEGYKNFRSTLLLDPNHRNALNDIRQCMKALDVKKLMSGEKNKLILALLNIERHDYKRAIENFYTVIPEFNIRNQLVYALIENGEFDVALKFLEQNIKEKPDCTETAKLMAHYWKEVGCYEKSELYYGLAMKDDCREVMTSRGFMRYLSGRPLLAIEDFKNVGFENIGNQYIKYIYGVALVSIGQFKEGVEILSKIMAEKGYICATFFREIAKYIHQNLDKKLNLIDLDNVLDPKFKLEYVCRTERKSFQIDFPDINPEIKDVELNPRKELRKIVKASQRFGKYIQYNARGFVPNLRQHRSFGLSILWMGQQFRKMCKGGKVVPWRTFVNIAVLFRQISEPNDPVFWLDKLPEEDFGKGFGLDTPMLINGNKTPRYYAYYDKSLALFRNLMLKQLVPLPDKQDDLESADTIEKIVDLFGQSATVIAKCYSIESKCYLDGTRLTMQKCKDDSGYKFSIRIGGTPDRFTLFTYELSKCFEKLIVNGANNSNRVEELDEAMIIRLSLIFYYYWVNFAPLTRGTAGCGMAILHGFILGFGYEVISVIPDNVQIDWMAILTSDPNDFADAVMLWFRIRKTDLLETVPDLETNLCSLRDMITCLNYALFP